MSLRIFFVFFGVVLMSGCMSSDDCTSFECMEQHFLSNVSDYQYLVGRAKEVGATRITYDSIFPEELNSLPLIEGYRSVMRELGIEVGVQVHRRENYVEVIFRSSGVISRGEAMLFIFSGSPISKIAYLSKKNESGNLLCQPVMGYKEWHVCKQQS